MLNCWIYRMSGRYTPNSAWRSPLLIECIDPLRKHSNIKECCLYKMHWPTSKHAQRPYVALFFSAIRLMSFWRLLSLSLSGTHGQTHIRQKEHSWKKNSNIIKHKHSTCVLQNVLTHWNMFHFLRNRPFINCIDPLLQNLRFYDGPPVWDYKMYGRNTFCKGTGSTFHSVSFKGDKTMQYSYLLLWWRCLNGNIAQWKLNYTNSCCCIQGKMLM